MRYASKLCLAGAIALALSGCHRHTDSAAVSGDAKASQPMQLRIYDVPQAQTESLRQALAMVLAPGSQAAVTSPTPGKLLVYAPESSQDSISSALSSLANGKKDSAAPSSLNLRFWIVDAIHGDGTDDGTLNALGDVLKSWRTSMGPAHFKLVEAASGSVREGGEGEITTDYQIGYDTSLSTSGDIYIQLQVRSVQNSQRGQGLIQFRGQLSVTPGQFVVLAQTPAATGEAAASSDAPMARLLIMRVDRTQQR